MFLFLFAAWFQLFSPQGSTAVTQYQCPPCGCQLDSQIHLQPGQCNACQMPLVLMDSEASLHIHQTVGHLFQDGALGIFYPKLIYPVFVISILLGLTLLRKFFYHKKTLDPFLTLFVLVIAFYAFKNQIYGVDNGITNNPYYLFLPISWIMALGPLLWLHVQLFIQKDKRLQRNWIYHFIPAGIVWLGYIILAIGPQIWREQWMETPFETSFSHVEQILSLILGWIYWALAFRTFRIWRNKTPNHKKHKRWLTSFILTCGFLLVIWSLIIALNLLVYRGGITTLTYNPLWLTIFLVIVIVATTFFQDSKFFFTNGYQWYADDESWNNNGIEQKLHAYMTDKKPFLDPELNLNKLSSQTGINAKHLSTTLNKGVGLNFYDYVNGFRIDEVKKLLLNQENRNLTIEAMANMAGFKSKSSFNTAFKKVTQMTPREFLKNQGSN